MSVAPPQEPPPEEKKVRNESTGKDERFWKGNEDNTDGKEKKRNGILLSRCCVRIRKNWLEGAWRLCALHRLEQNLCNQFWHHYIDHLLSRFWSGLLEVKTYPSHCLWFWRFPIRNAEWIWLQNSVGRKNLQFSLVCNAGVLQVYLAVKFCSQWQHVATSCSRMLLLLVNTPCFRP